MCGIVGAITEHDLYASLIDGLSRLEYRGYDSAGIVLVDPQKKALWRRRKADGTQSVRELGRSDGNSPPKARTGLGHTRWATHGAPSEVNAHPHLDCSGRLALVHNGILENANSYAKALIERGHELYSETDSEVLVHLLEEALAAGCEITPLALLDGLSGVLSKVKGSFAIALVHADLAETIVVARRSNPLVVGLTQTESFLASDIPALIGRAEKFYAIGDNQLAVLSKGSLEVTNLEGDVIDPVEFHVDWDIEAAQKGGFDDFMTKEIFEQPAAVADTLRHQLGPLALDEMHLDDDDIRALTRVCIVAAGSSYHAALVAKYAMEKLVRLPTEVDIASEFRYRSPVLDEGTLTISVSQSGETLDTLQAQREAKTHGAKVIVVTNVVGSSMAREADGVLYTHAGPEVGVASTKCHLAQVVALELLVLHLAKVRNSCDETVVQESFDHLGELSAKLYETLSRRREVDAVASELFGARDFFFLGRGVGYPVALEGALKLKELSYLRAEGYPAGELKHGPIALIVPGTVVVAVATEARMFDKIMANVAEVKSRGTKVVLLTTDDQIVDEGLVDFILRVPPTDPLLSPVLSVVPLQFLAYRLAKLLGNDVDRPRNLAKTVTVE